MKAWVYRHQQSATSYWLLAVLCFASLSPAAVDTLTVERCARLAVKNHPQVRSGQGSLELGKSGFQGARSAFLPQVSLQGAAGASQGTAVAGVSAQNYSAGIQAQQLIFDFGRTWNTTAGYSRSYGAAQAEYDGTLQTVALNAETAYFSLLQAQSVRQVAREGVAQAQAHLDQANALLQAGRGVRFNVVKAEVDLANGRLNLIKAENNVKVSRLQLRNTLNTGLADSLVLLDSLAVIPETLRLDQAVQAALAGRPEVLAARRRAESAEYLYHSAQWGRLPVLLGSAGYGARRSDWSDPWSQTWNAGITLNLPVFQGGAIQGAVGRARGSLRIAEANRQITEQSVALEVEQQFLTLQEAQQRLEASHKLLEQAEIALTLAQERYKLGSGSPLELTDSELAFQNARIQKIQAGCDYRIAQIRLYRAVGTLRVPE